MDLGIIGLGRMGYNMAIRLLQSGHRVIGNARTKETVDSIVSKGAEGAYSLDELTKKLEPPRKIWLMIPAGAPVDKTIEALLPRLETSDIIIDGGNSNYKDTLRRANMLKEKGIHFVDVGTSGGIWGLSEGYCIMVGGEKEVIENLKPIFMALAPAPDKGWGHVGPNGAGHFVKMIHNGIEYGLMQAYAEGFSLMKKKEEFKLDMYRIAEIWRHGSVIRSWLLDLTAHALSKDSDLTDVIPYVQDSGEGRWTVFEAIDLDVSAPIITMSLLRRLSSRDEESYADKLLSLMRESFGGHTVRRND